MDNTHNNVEFGVLQKTSKQSLISIFFYIKRGDTPLPYPPALGTSSLDYTKTGPPPHPQFPRSAPDTDPIVDPEEHESTFVAEDDMLPLA